MRLLYLAPIRLPSERAHGKQIMKTCEALAENGYQVTLVHPERALERTEDPFLYYGIRHPFSIKKIRTWDGFRRGRVGFFLALVLFFLRARQACGKSWDVAYARVDWLAYIASFFFATVVWEAHEARTGFSARRLRHRPNVSVIAITQGILDVQRAAGIRFSRETVVPDAVDLAVNTTSADEIASLRVRLGLGADERVLLYAGSIGLYPWKGVDVLIEMAKIAPSPWRIVILGGSSAEIEAWKEKTGDVRCVWHPAVPPTEVAAWYALADAFVLPNRAGSQASERFTSPMKLFEYLGEGKPILASRLPSIEEAVSQREVWFMSPDAPLEEAARFFACADTPDWIRLGAAARAKAHEYTWTKRAERIASFIERALVRPQG